jgi:hypothetical protein
MEWIRKTFTVELLDAQKIGYVPCEVRGIVSPPWAIYRGTKYRAGEECFTVVHLPSGILYITLERRKDCQALVADLMALRIAWEESDPAKVRGPDTYLAAEVVSRYQRDPL